MLPSVIYKTVYDKVFISKEALSAVKNWLTHCIYPETLNMVIQHGCLCKSNNKKLIELSYTTFIK